MDDNIHMYESIVGYQEGHKTDSEAVTHFDNKQEYGSSKYEEPQSQWCAAENTRTAVNNAEVKGPSDCYVQRDELKQIKKWLCVLSLLVAILLLIILASLSLAAYTFYSIGGSTSRSQIQTASNDRLETHLNVTSEDIRQLKKLITTLDTRINDNNMQVENLETVTKEGNFQLRNLVTTLGTRVNDTDMQVENLKMYLNVTSKEVSQLRNLITTLDTHINNTNTTLVSLVRMIDSRINIAGRDVVNLRSTVNIRLNTINSEVVSQMTFINTTNAAVTDLQRQLNTYMYLANSSSLQIALRSQPLIRLSRVTVRTTTSTLTATFAKLNSVTFNKEGSTTTISTSPSSAITSGNILAYRPNYRDEFRSDLGTIFIHVEAVYPCATDHQQISCKLFPNEDDGFRGGRAIFEAMDGPGFGVFSGTTYAFAIEGCSQIDYSCYSSSFTLEFTLVCLVPSSVCS